MGYIEIEDTITTTKHLCSDGGGGGGGFSNGHLVTSFLPWLLRDVTESHVATVTLSSNGLE
jgi:hypothetical protein